MEVKWWGLGITCPKCKIPVQIQTMDYSSDGELRFNCVCSTCQQMVTWRIFAGKLQHRALIGDIENNGATTAVVPPKKPNLPLLPPVKEKLEEGDEGWLHNLGICPTKTK